MLPLLGRTLLVLASAFLLASYAAGWKLVLKDGKTIECDAPPIVVDGTYLFRGTDGKDGAVSAEQIDLDKTSLANKAGSRTQWREVGRSATSPAPQRPNRTAGAGVLAFKDADFDREVLRSEVPVLVDFWATWCGPCKTIAPTVDAIASEYSGRLKVGKVDIDENDATAARYRIEATPTLLLFKNGRVAGQIVGAASGSEIARMLRAHL